MDTTEFWQLIAASKAAITSTDFEEAQDEQYNALYELLMQKNVEEIIVFETQFTNLYRVSYRTDIWDAACIVNGGCSDDGFDYFRAWLIGAGQEAYEAVCQDPDNLILSVPKDIELLDPESEEEFYLEFEQLLSVASTAYATKTGQDLYENDLWEKVEPHVVPIPELLGDFLVDDPEKVESLRKAYPRLYARFCQEGE
jgi:hypothetical protein